MMKKSVKVVCLLCAAMMGATVFTSCDMLGSLLGGTQNNNSSSGSNTPAEPEKQTAAVSYVSLDINPYIELTVDDENKVVSVYGGNEDGQVLLYKETGIVGEDIEKAVEKIVDLAVDLGYLDENNKVVGTGVVSEETATESALLTKVNAKVTAAAQDLGLTVTTDAAGAYSLLRDLEALKAAYPNNEAIQNVSISKFKLAVSASETGEVALEAAVEMDTEELVDLVANAHTQMETFATDAYESARLQASATYEKALGMAKAGVYMEYTLSSYMGNVLNIGKAYNFVYASSYFMYEASASGFESSADALACVERLHNYELSETQVKAVLSALTMEDTAENRALLQNSDGKITVDSVEAYADKLFKNTPASEELETMKTALNMALGDAEKIAKEAIEEVKATYGPQIEEIVKSAETGLSQMEVIPEQIMAQVMPATINQAITDFKTIAANVRTTIQSNSFSEGTLRQLANEMNEKSETILKEIKTKLTEEDLQAIQTKMEETEAKYADVKAEMEDKIAQAEEDAKKKLEELKNARKTADN